MGNWQQLIEQCEKCTACDLAKTRNHVVVGQGVSNAEVMFIGEGPGQNEDEQGQPFVGRAGVLLDKLLAAVGLSRQHNIYITNIVKCRPPKNRDPKPEEWEACTDWLRQQTALLKPKIIVCLGRVAACRLIEPDFKVTQQHGEFFEKEGTLMMGTFHPAAILRNPNNKPKIFSDFTDLRDKITQVCTHTEFYFPEELD